MKDTASTNAYNNSFTAQNDDEKTRILKSLGNNDLVEIYPSYYRIKSIDKETITLEKSSIEHINTMSFTKPLDASLIPENSYSGYYKIDKADFYKNNFTIADKLHSSVHNYLDW